VRDLVLVYYALIRSGLRLHPHLWPYLKRCKHCRIYFFTDPRNKKRADLRCPFGCREAHRRENSTRRSVAYHREHKEKKAALNRRRYLVSARRQAQESPRAEESEAPRQPMLRHVRMLCSLIEGRPVSLQEVLEMLRRNRRQHRMARERRVDYVVERVNDRGS
jgi:hypothetical protein